MKIRNLETDAWESISQYPGLTNDTPIHRFLKNGNEIVISDYRGRDTLGLYIYDLSQRSITRTLFHNDEYDASGVVVSADGETVLGAKYVAEKEEVELLGDYGSALSRLRSKFSEYSIDYMDHTEDFKTLVVRMSAPYDPGGGYTLDTETDEMTLLQTRYSGLESEDMGNTFPIKYSARDGQKIPAFVTLPPTITSTIFRDARLWRDADEFSWI